MQQALKDAFVANPADGSIKENATGATAGGEDYSELWSDVEEIEQGKLERKRTKGRRQSPGWVYVSGPGSFIQAGESACKAVGVDYYGARWDV